MVIKSELNNITVALKSLPGVHEKMTVSGSGVVIGMTVGLHEHTASSPLITSHGRPLCNLLSHFTGPAFFWM